MAFMRPFYTNEPFHTGDSREGGVSVPADVYSSIERFIEETGCFPDTAELVPAGKWWVRLSAPGYMDATEWDGPYDTETEARAALVEAYEVDADTGDDLDDSEGDS
jgi:hypothetical protein